jgi:hypothetical protein
MRRLILAAMMIALGAGMAVAQTLSPEAFTERFAKAFGQAVHSNDITVARPLQLEMRTAAGTRSINLSNTYREYLGSPERFDELVEIFADAVRHPIPPKLDRAYITPMIKDRAWLAQIEPLFRQHNGEVLSEPFNAELAIVYAEDSNTRARYLDSREDVGERSALRALAIDNLARLLPTIQMRQFGELFLISAGGNYEPSLLLFDQIWSGGQIKVDGDIVVAIPARDMLLVTGSKNRKGLKAMREMAAKAMQGAYRLTDTLFVYRGGKFVKFGRK